MLQLTGPPNIEDTPSLCNKAIATIISKANKKLTKTLRRKEDAQNRQIAKRYHQNLKIAAGILPRAKD
jgi:hypothetical protein